MNWKNKIGYCLTSWIFVINVSNSQYTNTTNTISSSENPFSSELGIQHVLSRKKRYLLFPPGAAFVATMSFAKAIATNNPRGVNFVVETDFYYPMYSSISELFPKDKKPVAPKPLATTTTIPITHLSVVENPKFDSFPGTYFDTSNFELRRKEDSKAYLNYREREYIPLNPSYKYWQSPKPYYRSHYRPATNYVPKPIYKSSNTYTNKYRDLNWRQRELYRSRRDLYSHIEGMAEKHGFEIKTCIHRMICEGRHYLLPPGKSFFQDVLRILITLPVIGDNTGDGYSEAMQATEDECLSIYSEKCPYSIVGYILHSQQEIKK